MINLQKLTDVFVSFENSSFTNNFIENIDFLKDRDTVLYTALLQSYTSGVQMNSFLFTLPVTENRVIAWMAKTQGQYVWMTSMISEEVATIRNIIQNNIATLKQNILTNFSELPPNLLYVNVFAQSKWQQNLNDSFDSKVSDFSIFQVQSEEDKIRDIDQLMIINSDFLINQCQYTREIMEKYCSSETLLDYDKLVLSHASLLTKLHTELHNIGHFMGAFPYETKTKNNSNYEAIEEFKACLTAIEIINQTGVDKKYKDGLSLLIICTRIFNYGYRSHFAKHKNKQIVREITVGVLFFELMKKYSVIEMSRKITIHTENIMKVTQEELERLYELEQLAVHKLDYLDQIACDYYKFAYPDSNLSSDLACIYT